MNFQGKYYENEGDVSANHKGLTIGSYESVWLEDLIVAFLFEKCKKILSVLKYKRIYRDDGICVTKKKMTNQQIDDWLQACQKEVNSVAGNTYLQWTVLIWNVHDNGTINPLRENNFFEITINEFSFLDMKLSWNLDDNLEFSVYRKENPI